MTIENKQALQDYIKQRVMINEDTGCWEWLLGTNRQGYGKSSNLRKKYGKSKIHQLSYIAFKGPIPEGMCVCHSCDNPKCCNPDHLWLGTHTDNMRDMISKGRKSIKQGEHAPRSKLTNAQAWTIRMLGNDFPIKTIAFIYGVNIITIYYILHNKSYKVPSDENPYRPELILSGNGNNKLNASQAWTIRQLYKTYSVRTIAFIYGVTRVTIYDVINNKRYKEVQ